MGGGGGLSTVDCLKRSDCFVATTSLLHLRTGHMRNIEKNYTGNKDVKLTTYTHVITVHAQNQHLMPTIHCVGLTVGNADDWVRTLDCCGRCNGSRILHSCHWRTKYKAIRLKDSF